MADSFRVSQIGLIFAEASAKSGENVEESFMETAKQIYDKIQNGSLDLNAAESGVQKKTTVPVTDKSAAAAGSCAC